MDCCFPCHTLPIHDSQTSHGLKSEEDIFGDGQLGDNTKLLMDHSDAGAEGIARRTKSNRNSVEPPISLIITVPPHYNLHQPPLSRPTPPTNPLHLPPLK